MEHFNLTLEFLNSIFGIVGIYRLFLSSRAELFWSGFFVGIFWFYWIGISYQYYGLELLAPFVIVLIGFCYAMLFVLTDSFQNIYIRAILLFALSYIHPFGFNWFDFELIFITSLFVSNTINLAILTTCSGFLDFDSKYKVYFRYHFS